MWGVFLQTMPFFMVIAVGYAAARSRFFPADATGYLTQFVFYFALSAMLFRFASNLSLEEVFNWPFVLAYLCGTVAVYLLATGVALWRRLPMDEAAIEAQCATIGNVGFLGIPMLALLLGTAAVAPVMMVLAVDLIVFGSLVVILITGSRDGRMSPRILGTIALGLLKNPMIVSMALGLLTSAIGLRPGRPINDFLDLLGGAATPCALFVIGASLAGKSAERVVIAGWLSLCKLVLHPAAVAVCALLVFPVEPYAAGVMIAAAALPVAGNVYIIAQHYRVAPARASASILLSTICSVLTVAVVVAWVGP